MTIKRNLDDLPTPGTSQKGSGWAADDAPRFAHLLATKWHAENMAAGERPHAVKGTRFRHSDAGGCARKIAYKAAGLAPTNPMDITGSWNTRLGTMIHDAWQEALQEAYPYAEIEVASQAFAEGSGSMDALINIPDGPLVSYELKTVGGYAFKSAIGKIRRGTPPEGPKSDHIIQGALNALAHNADELVIGYLAKETLSKNYDDVPDISKFTAEWSMTREQFEPIARLEIERIEGILALLDKGELAARKVPGYPGVIVNVNEAIYELSDAVGPSTMGTIWNGSFCTYCAFFDLCRAQPMGAVAAGRIPVEQMVELRKGIT